MATYTELQFNQSAWYLPTGGPGVAGQSASRTLANGDIIKFDQIQKDTKIMGLTVGSDRLDTNGTPTMTGVWEITDGTTPLTLCTTTTANHGSATASARVARLDVPSMIGYVVATAGYWLQFRVTAALATAAAGKVYYELALSARMNPGEGPHAPTG